MNSENFFLNGCMHTWNTPPSSCNTSNENISMLLYVKLRVAVGTHNGPRCFHVLAEFSFINMINIASHGQNNYALEESNFSLIARAH